MQKPIQEITLQDLIQLDVNNDDENISNQDTITNTQNNNNSVDTDLIVTENSNPINLYSNSNSNSNSNNGLNSSQINRINPTSINEINCGLLGFEYKFGASLGESLSCNNLACNRVYSSHPFVMIPNGSFVNRKISLAPQQKLIISPSDYGWSKLNYVYLKADCGEFLYSFNNEQRYIQAKFLFLDLNNSIYECEENQLIDSSSEFNICSISLFNKYPLEGLKIYENIIIKNVAIKLLLVGS